MSGTAPLKTIGSVQAKRNAYAQTKRQDEQFYDAGTIRVVVVIQGRPFLVPRVSVINNAHGASDSAEVTLPIKGSPDFTLFIARSDANTSIVPIQIYVGIFHSQPPSQDVSIAGLTQLFSGQVDMYTMVFDADEVTFQCRSLASVLIDNRLTGMQRSLKTTDFVAQVAAQYNLTPNIMLPPKQYKITVAEIYAQTYSVGIQNWRLWDMLLKMAEFDDADVWVSGSTLNYVAPSLIKRNIVDIKYGRDIEKLTVTHSPLFSKNIRVDVRSYTKKNTYSTTVAVETADDGTSNPVTNSKLVVSNPVFGSNTQNSTSTNLLTGAQSQTSRTTSGGVRNTAAGTGPLGEGGPLRYPIYAFGLSPQAVNLLAQSTWGRLSRMEYTATMVVPLTNTYLQSLSITSKVNLHGVPMQQANNPTYWPRRITWSIDIDSGASIEIEAISIKLPPGQV